MSRSVLRRLETLFAIGNLHGTGPRFLFNCILLTRWPRDPITWIKNYWLCFANWKSYSSKHGSKNFDSFLYFHRGPSVFHLRSFYGWFCCLYFWEKFHDKKSRLFEIYAVKKPWSKRESSFPINFCSWPSSGEGNAFLWILPLKLYRAKLETSFLISFDVSKRGKILRFKTYVDSSNS